MKRHELPRKLVAQGVRTTGDRLPTVSPTQLAIGVCLGATHTGDVTLDRLCRLVTPPVLAGDVVA